MWQYVYLQVLLEIKLKLVNLFLQLDDSNNLPISKVIVKQNVMRVQPEGNITLLNLRKIPILAGNQI